MLWVRIALDELLVACPEAAAIAHTVPPVQTTGYNCACGFQILELGTEDRCQRHAADQITQEESANAAERERERVKGQ